MKKYLIFLFILAALIGISCNTTTPATTATTTPPTTSTQPATSPTPAPTPPPAAPPPVVVTNQLGLDMSGATNYTVVIGDFLSEITRTFYGSLTDVGPAGTRNGFYYPLLMLASEGLITDPDLIFPGTNLKIPDLKKNLDNPSSRRAIKDCLREAAGIYNRKRLPDEEQGLLRLSDYL